MNLANLPPESQFHVFTYLPFQSLPHLELTHSTIFPAANDDFLWRNHYNQRFPASTEFNPQLTWKQNFQRQIEKEKNWKNGDFISFTENLPEGEAYLNTKIKFNNQFWIVSAKTHVYVKNIFSDETFPISNNNESINSIDFNNNALAISWNSTTCLYNLKDNTFVSLNPQCLLSCLKINDLLFAFGVTNGAIGIFNRESAQGTFMKGRHPCRVSCITDIPQDRAHIFTGASELKYWDVSTGQCVNTTEKDNSINCMIPLDENSLISGCSEGEVQLWDTRDNKKTILKAHERAVKCLGLSPNGFISGSRDCKVMMWDLRNPVPFLLNTHQDSVTCLQSDQQKVVSGAYNGEIVVKYFTGESYSLAKRGMSVTSLQYDDSKLLASYSDGRIDGFSFEKQSQFSDMIIQDQENDELKSPSPFEYGEGT